MTHTTPRPTMAAFHELIATQAHRLALELECLLLDTQDLSVQSKWWSSAHAALDLYRWACSEGRMLLEQAEAARPREFDPDWDLLKATQESLREHMAEQEQEPVVDCPRCGHCCPQRLPLTDEQIRHMKPISPDFVDFRSGVRCAERAHGIGDAL